MANQQQVTPQQPPALDHDVLLSEAGVEIPTMRLDGTSAALRIRPGTDALRVRLEPEGPTWIGSEVSVAALREGVALVVADVACRGRGGVPIPSGSVIEHLVDSWWFPVEARIEQAAARLLRRAVVGSIRRSELAYRLVQSAGVADVDRLCAAG